MKTINTISSIEGRILLHQIFKELRFEKQYSTFTTLLRLWSLCINAKNINKLTKRNVEILHSLGFFSGTGLWLGEIVNRYYFSTINSLVYFGAAVLLVLVGLRRFSDIIDDNIVLLGVGFEALMLLFMFFVMLFSPSEDITLKSDSDDIDEANELLTEIGEIAKEFASAVMAIENLSEKVDNLAELQRESIDKLNNLGIAFANATSPNPELVTVLKQTNEELVKFKDGIVQLSNMIETVKNAELELIIKQRNH